MSEPRPYRDDRGYRLGFRFLADELDDLRREYPTWWRRVGGAATIYAIPEAALDVLRPFFPPADWYAEREYTRRCERMRAIGHGGRNLISYSLLKRMPFPTAATFPFARDLSLAQWAAVGEAERAATDRDRRLLGVVGRLVTEPWFVREAASLRAKWLRLSPAVRPDLPWRPSVGSPAPVQDQRRAAPPAARFAAAVDEFLDRWGLDALFDRHLPSPRGPQFWPGQPPVAVGPATGVHVFLPFHYPLRGDDPLLGAIEQLQRAAAATRGLPPAVAAAGHVERYTHIAKLVHLETAVRSRFPGTAPRRLVGGIVGAAAELLALSDHSVVRLRKQARVALTARSAASVGR